MDYDILPLYDERISEDRPSYQTSAANRIYDEKAKMPLALPMETRNTAEIQ